MKYWVILAFLVIIYIAIPHVSCKGGLSGSRSSSKSRMKSGSSRSFASRTSGMSLAKKSMLIGAGGLAAAYIGFKLGSYNDISRYTVCEGSRYEYDEFGVRKHYKYTVCPMHLRYCCRDNSYDGERCCSGSWYGGSSPSMLGSVFGTLMMVGVISLVVYCCCCKLRKRRIQHSSSPDFQTISVPPQPYSPTNPVPPMGVSKSYEPSPPPYSATIPPYPGQVLPSPPYPTGPGGTGPEQLPQYPPSSEQPPYPSNPQFPPPTGANYAGGIGAPGSAWGAPPPPPATAPPPYPY